MQHNFFLIVLRKILDRNDQLLWSVGIGSALHLGVQVERPNSYCLLVSGPDIEVKCVTNSWLGRWQTKTTFLLTREWWEVRPVTTSSRTSQLSLSVQGTVHSTQYTVHSTQHRHTPGTHFPWSEHWELRLDCGLGRHQDISLDINTGTSCHLQHTANCRVRALK